MAKPEYKTISDLVWLAFTVWREARGEDRKTKLGVAYSILNRVQRPTWWGNSIMSVVFKRLQYSSMTDPHDPQLIMWPSEGDVWWECVSVAESAINKFEPNPAPHADSYYDISIHGDAETQLLKRWGDPPFVAQLGRIKFYNVDRDTEA